MAAAQWSIIRDSVAWAPGSGLRLSLMPGGSGAGDLPQRLRDQARAFLAPFFRGSAQAALSLTNEFAQHQESRNRLAQWQAELAKLDAEKVQLIQEHHAAASDAARDAVERKFAGLNERHAAAKRQIAALRDVNNPVAVALRERVSRIVRSLAHTPLVEVEAERASVLLQVERALAPLAEKIAEICVLDVVRGNEGEVHKMIAGLLDQGGEDSHAGVAMGDAAQPAGAATETPMPLWQKDFLNPSYAVEVEKFRAASAAPV